MRPERSKRPRIAADGTPYTDMPSFSSHKRQRVSIPEVTIPVLQPSKRSPVKKKVVKKSVLAEDASSESEVEQKEPAATATKSHAETPLELLSEDIVEEFLPEAKRRALSVLAGQLPPPGFDIHGAPNGSECVGLEDQWMNLRATIRGTLQGEGNSALIIGARGSGKSLLLNSVLRHVESESRYHLVQLDGTIQPTDRLSMRELARQLVKKGAIKLPKEGEEGALDFGLEEEEETNVEDDVLPSTNGLDAKEGQENNDEERQAVENAVLSSIANTTSTILTLLSTASNSKKGLPLIITLSSFDLFTSRPRQALLYVLLDAVQAGSYTPGLCVIGMTSRLDTTDLLEKRVRSRFGGRTINVWPEDVWIKVLKRTLLLAGLTKNVSNERGSQFEKAWKSEVEAICKHEKVLNLLEDTKAISNTVQSMYKIVYPLIASLATDDPSLLSAFTDYQRSITSTLTNYSILSDLTITEFGLLIASKQILNRNREVFNFEMCFDELKKFVQRIEMDRMGASANVVHTISGANDTSRRRAIGEAISGTSLGWQGLLDRKRVMMAFRSLLQLELFQPEASINTLSLNGPATSLLTARGAQIVRTEYLRVKCTIFPQDIIAAARATSRKGTLGTHMIQWATSNG